MSHKCPIQAMQDICKALPLDVSASPVLDVLRKASIYSRSGCAGPTPQLSGPLLKQSEDIGIGKGAMERTSHSASTHGFVLSRNVHAGASPSCISENSNSATIYSPRLPAEKRLEQADPTLPPIQNFVTDPPPPLWDPPRSLGAAANRCCGGSRLSAAPTEGNARNPPPPFPPPTPSSPPMPALDPCPTPQTADKRILRPTNPSHWWDRTPLEGASRRHRHILHALGRPGCRGGARKRLIIASISLATMPAARFYHP